MNDIWSQLRDESVHLAFLAIVGGVGVATACLGWLIRRDICRAEKDSAERGLAITALKEEFTEHVRRNGLEISDVKQRVAVLAAQVKRDIPEIDIPSWPSR